jgi:hypothetical protein
MRARPVHRPAHPPKAQSHHAQSHHDQKAASPKPPPKRAAALTDTFGDTPKRPVLGNGEVSVDFNGTPYTNLEGSAGDSHISIEAKRSFDPVKEPGIALTTAQAKALGVEVGDQVAIRDTVTNKVVLATFYDSAGKKPGQEQSHFEVSPALADTLGIRYRDSKGRVRDAVFNSEQMDGRFSIEPAPK